MIESPRWLVSQGKHKECIRELKVIAKINKTSVPEDALTILRRKFDRVDKSYGVMSLFTSWRLAKNTTMLVIIW